MNSCGDGVGSALNAMIKVTESEEVPPAANASVVAENAMVVVSEESDENLNKEN
jgi:hypothetical protein